MRTKNIMNIEYSNEEQEWRKWAVERIGDRMTGDKEYFRDVSKEDLAQWSSRELKDALDYLEMVLCYAEEKKAE